MKEYDKLAKLKTFTLREVTRITGNENTSASLISRLLKKNYVSRIRKDLYTCIDLTTGDVVASKYQIASAINEDAYISHHTAFEFYGIANQVYNTVFVSSKKRFNTFEFMGITYKRVKSDFIDGVIEIKNIEGVRIADKERALVDSVYHVSKIGGVEELTNIIKMIDDLDTSKLLLYMDKYSNKFLYQKMGYMLEAFYSGYGLNEHFFQTCQIKSGNSVRYLVQDREGLFQQKWNIIVPEAFLSKTYIGGEPDEYI